MRSNCVSQVFPTIWLYTYLKGSTSNVMKSVMYRLIQSGVFFTVMSVALLAPAAAEPVYTIDQTRSEFALQLFKAGVGSALAHDHVVRATTYTGQIRFDPSTPSSGSVTME